MAKKYWMRAIKNLSTSDSGEVYEICSGLEHTPEIHQRGTNREVMHILLEEMNYPEQLNQMKSDRQLFMTHCYRLMEMMAGQEVTSAQEPPFSTTVNGFSVIDNRQGTYPYWPKAFIVSHPQDPDKLPLSILKTFVASRIWAKSMDPDEVIASLNERPAYEVVGTKVSYDAQGNGISGEIRQYHDPAMHTGEYDSIKH